MNASRSSLFNRRLSPVLAPALALLGLVSCSPPSHTGLNEEGIPVVTVPIPPYAGLVERLAGDAVEVRILVSENDDPHEYSPTPGELARASGSALYFTAGLPFEEILLEKLGGKGPEIVSLVEGLDLRHFAEGEHDHNHGHEDGHEHGDTDHGEHGHAEDHGEKGHEHGEDSHHEEHEAGHDEDHPHDGEDHEHKEDHHHEHEEDHHHEDGHDHHHGHSHDDGELDPHAWFSPALLAQQTMLLRDALSELVDGDSAARIQENASALVREINELDRELASALSPMRGKSFYVYHGAFGYFADAFGLVQEPIEIAGRSPEPKQLIELMEKARADGVGLIIVQPQFDRSSAETLAEELDAQVVAVNPLAKDVLANLRRLGGLVKGDADE